MDRQAADTGDVGAVPGQIVHGDRQLDSLGRRRGWLGRFLARCGARSRTRCALARRLTRGQAKRCAEELHSASTLSTSTSWQVFSAALPSRPPLTRTRAPTPTTLSSWVCTLRSFSEYLSGS